MGNVCKNRDSNTRPHPKGVGRPASHWRRRCAGPSICPALLDALQMKVAPAAQDVLSAVETLKTLNAENARKVPQDVPTRFVRKRWESLVFKAEGVDRRFYELCTLSALKNALRSGDLWVQGSRQFKDFGDDL